MVGILFFDKTGDNSKAMLSVGRNSLQIDAPCSTPSIGPINKQSIRLVWQQNVKVRFGGKYKLLDFVAKLDGKCIGTVIMPI